MTTFQYKYNGDKPELKFLSGTDWEKWTFKSFRNYLSGDNNSRLVTRKKAKSLFLQGLSTVKSSRSTPKYVKKHIGRIFDELEDKSTPAPAPAPAPVPTPTPTPITHTYYCPIHIGSPTYNGSFINGDQSSGSDDYTSKRTKKRTNVVISDNDNDDQDNHIKPNEKWRVSKKNITNMLLKYRDTSLLHNITKKHKELKPARVLSMSHVFFFPIKREESCVAHMDIYVQDKMYEEFREFSALDEKANGRISHYIDHMREASLSGDNRALTKVRGEVLLLAAEETENEDLLMMSGNALSNITKQIVNVQPSDLSKKQYRSSEDTFIHNYLSPWLENVFLEPSLEREWANVQMVSFKKSKSKKPKPDTMNLKKCYPDYKLCSTYKKKRYDLFVVEVKPPSSSLALGDLRKLSYELYSMVNAMVDIGVESPVVCGIWVDGCICTTYKMDLEYNGLYRFIELDSFTLPTTIEELEDASSVLDALFKLKRIIQSTDIKLKEAKGRREALMKWKRVYCKEEVSKKTKK